MTGFDYTVAGVMILFTLLGFWRGAVRQILILLAVIAGAMLAARHHETLAEFIPFAPETLRPAIAWCSILLASLLVGWVLAWIAGRFVKAADMGCANRLLGGLLGAAKGGLLVGMVALVLVLTLPPDHRFLAGSRTLPHILRGLEAGDRLMSHDLRERFRERAAAFPSVHPPEDL